MLVYIAGIISKLFALIEQISILLPEFFHHIRRLARLILARVAILVFWLLGVGLALPKSIVSLSGLLVAEDVVSLVDLLEF